MENSKYSVKDGRILTKSDTEDQGTFPKFNTKIQPPLGESKTYAGNLSKVDKGLNKMKMMSMEDGLREIIKTNKD
jgi:hypothetical protein